MPPNPPTDIGLGLMWWSARNPPADPTVSLSGRTVLITGANVGLGLEAAVKTAALGAKGLILGVRSLQKGEDTKRQICQRTGYDPNKVRYYELDMSRFASVESFAKTVEENEPRVDAAILNAGTVTPAFVLSPEGYETTLQVNVLSTALLGVLLLPQLQKSATISGKASHLEFVGSVAHHRVKASQFDLSPERSIIDQANSKSFFGLTVNYHVSKLLLMYVMEGLVQATRTPGCEPNVIITNVCPCLCRTNLGRDFGSPMKLANYLFHLPFARTAEEGSRTLVSGITLGPEANGEFWSHDRLYKKGDLVTSAEGKALQKRVWKEIVDILIKNVPDLDGHLSRLRGQ
ncbi:hypothetical protein PV10_02737 [Exophiala mesophila]|uniref:Uncharacterized protein n=1 Tax=Exophiala mesophila TaxID=212818 RepID=A0A0D1WZX0_EXOME|nr:uncharacterized protein PV10_02737 [Exophiala mesophila]KIV95030.1 hypothetical protein PV10_02737 [Exophiala mesophila]